MVEAWCVFDCSILLKFAVYVVLSILGESTSDGVPFSPDRKMFRVWRWIESIDYRQFVCPFLRGGVGRWAQIFVAKVGFPLGISPCMCSFSVPATKWLFWSLVCPSSRFSFEALFGSFVCNSRQACSFSSERLKTCSFLFFARPQRRAQTSFLGKLSGNFAISVLPDYGRNSL